MSNINKWDKNIPVEKSNYLQDDKVTFFNVDNSQFNKNSLKLLDLFCGAGGFSVGCNWAGIESVMGIDHFEPAIKTWVKNHPNSIGCLGDITQINPYEIKNILKKKDVDKINLITGGVPCQGFSIANRKHNDSDTRNFLFLEYMKFVKVFRPDYIILENVSGMRSTAGGHFENAIKSYMENLGYIVSIKMLNAADYGVPQIRQRLLFVGVNKTISNIPYVFPVGLYKDKYITVGEAIGDLPSLNNNEYKTQYESKPYTNYQKLMRGEIKSININKPTYLANHQAPNHPENTIKRIRETTPGNPMYPKFKQRIRLNNENPSPTQLAGGIRPQFQFGHPTESRGLSIRERARLQSFPDEYVFEGGIVQERVQTGNAVPPLLIYELIKPIVNNLSVKKGKNSNV
ncbi:MAG: DNA cytosine methyltransferase [Veillonella caviae]|uniref:DNA cytosine methyltransferase n=1 Tax=Veillonella caviae TaxID=248316 RepID=UPI002A7F1FE5|nr:DNA cytosine methyltransferase [Veillonella caviae]MDY4746162.1 DNA cytosine methyltransferase [Veillonella caviae]MDY5480777.1 DNA cytosine methyltransferase [Veillonella caviae]